MAFKSVKSPGAFPESRSPLSLHMCVSLAYNFTALHSFRFVSLHFTERIRSPPVSVVDMGDEDGLHVSNLYHK